MEVDRVAEPVPLWGDQDHSSPRAGSHGQPVEVHHPVLVGDTRGRGLDLSPFDDEVSQGLRLDRSAGGELDVVAHELERLLRDPACGIAVADDLPQWARGDDCNLVVCEVVQELPVCHQHGVQKLLDLGVAYHGIGEHLTDKVHWLLNLQHVPWLLPLDDKDGADNVVACCNVEEEGFFLLGSDEDWG